MNYEQDDDLLQICTVDRYDGIAWSVLGWETKPDLDTEWTGIEERTGRVVAVMIGDDRHFSIDREEIHSLDRKKYCGECGQIGCCHDGLDRT